MIRYSVIVPHYESLDVLPRAVASVPERTDIEVLVVDNSKQAIDADLFSNRQNVRILYSPYGKGAGAARNVGLEHAKGEWIVFLDADDFFTENAFDMMDKQAESNADIVFFKMSSCDSDTLAPANRDMQFNELLAHYLDQQDEGALRYEWGSPCAKMIRRSLIAAHAIRFDETQASNDVLFSLLTGYYAKRITASADTIYCATIRANSLTTTPSMRNLLDRIDVSIRYNRFVRTHGLKRYQKSIMYYVLTIARHYGYGEALKTVVRSIKAGNNPFIGCTRWISTIQKNHA
jgi:glycosyltransferase involved in cell wall biosynthesis